MRKLNRLQNLIYNIGGLILLVGAFLPIVSAEVSAAPYIYSVGALMFSSMQLLQRYEGSDITVKRLRRQQILGAVMLLAAGVFMFCSLYNVSPFNGSEWQIVLAIAAVLEVYTAFRIPAALEKEGRK